MRGTGTAQNLHTFVLSGALQGKPGKCQQGRTKGEMVKSSNKISNTKLRLQSTAVNLDCYRSETLTWPSCLSIALAYLCQNKGVGQWNLFAAIWCCTTSTSLWNPLLLFDVTTLNPPPFGAFPFRAVQDAPSHLLPPSCSPHLYWCCVPMPDTKPALSSSFLNHPILSGATCWAQHFSCLPSQDSGAPR